MCLESGCDGEEGPAGTAFRGAEDVQQPAEEGGLAVASGDGEKALAGLGCVVGVDGSQGPSLGPAFVPVDDGGVVVVVADGDAERGGTSGAADVEEGVGEVVEVFAP